MDDPTAGETTDTAAGAPLPLALTRHDVLVGAAERYRTAAQANYDRVTTLAERVRAGLCGWLGAMDGTCVFLVPALGPYETRAYGEAAFSMRAKGFKSLDPILFGLAIRITREGDWFRLPVTARRDGPRLDFDIHDGPTLSLGIEPTDTELEAVFQAVHAHVLEFFQRGLSLYENGDYAGGEIGFRIASP